jgi:choline dehydrogenase-like flavoprotein
MAVVYGLFEEETDCHMGVSAGQFTHREGFTNPARPGIHGGLQWQIGPAVKPNDLFGIAMTRADLFGQPLHDFVHQAAKHFAFMVGFCGGEHQRENRVALSTRTDQNGMPLAHAIHSLPAEVVALSSYMDQQGRSVFEAAGARQIWSAPPPVGHLVGGTIMGRDPSDSVTDSYGICHDVPNLVLAGSGLFPASDGASPTFTLLAVASRSVDHLLAGWSEQRP